MNDGDRAILFALELGYPLQPWQMKMISNLLERAKRMINLDSLIIEIRTALDRDPGADLTLIKSATLMSVLDVLNAGRAAEEQAKEEHADDNQTT